MSNLNQQHLNTKRIHVQRNLSSRDFAGLTGGVREKFHYTYPLADMSKRLGPHDHDNRVCRERLKSTGTLTLFAPTYLVILPVVASQVEPSVQENLHHAHFVEAWVQLQQASITYSISRYLHTSIKSYSITFLSCRRRRTLVNKKNS